MEPFHAFMHNPEFIYRLGSKTSNHVNLKLLKKNIFILQEGPIEIGRQEIPPEHPEFLGTFVRFNFYKHFLGEARFVEAIKKRKLFAANTFEYPSVQKISRDKPLNIKPLQKSTEEVINISQNQSETSINQGSLSFNPSTPEKKSPQHPSDEVIKTIEGEGKSTAPEKLSWLSRIFDEKRFPLIFALGGALGGPLNPEVNNNGALKGLEFAFGAHFKKGWSSKIFTRYFTARDSQSRSLLEQNLTGLIVMKSVGELPIYLLAGGARESLKKRDFQIDKMNKAIFGVGLSVGGYLSFEIREEIPLAKYDRAYQVDTENSFVPIFLVSVGRYL